MKKYFNKGLIYQWFNSAKMMILLGIIAWGFFANIMVEDHIREVSHNIYRNFENGYSLYTIFTYGVLGIIFALIHFMSQGINKRHNNMFLTGAPYTKKQIKYNEFICLMINLAIFIVILVYINMMAYVRHYELMTIVDGYFTALGIEVLRMILFGTLGILLLLIIDSMFSNTIIGIICMISVLPASLFFMVYKFFSILEYIPAGMDASMLDRFGEYIGNNLFGRKPLYLLDNAIVSYIDSSMFLNEIVIVLVIIAVLLLIYYIMQKRFKVESNTKIFTSRLNEKIIVIFSSIGAGCAASTILLNYYINDLMGIYYYGPLKGITLVKTLGLDLGCVVLIGFITYKIINKILKNIQ